MDVRNWPMDRIMQLPDECFGRRFPVSCSIITPVEGSVFDISEIALPEACVLWSLNLAWYSHSAEPQYFRLALGDHLPADAVVMDALEPLIPGLGVQGPDPRQIPLQAGHNTMCVPFRQPLSAMGRRVVLEVNTVAGQYVVITCVVVVSSIPREVPDWLNSEHLRSP